MVAYLQIQASELLALLQSKENAEDKLVQTDISNEDLDKVLDRGDLVVDSARDDAKVQLSVIPLKGPGWEVVIPVKSGGGMLASVNG